MVKANAYGVGIDVVVPVLLSEGCEIFFVATVIEGQRVRALCDKPIYVLAGVADSAEADLLHEAELRPVINSQDQLDQWDTSKPYALHIDTGMERLGFSFPEGCAVLQNLKQANAPALTLTHFARADEGDAEAIRTQLACIESLRELGLPLSVGNSAGILLHDVHEDVARAGIALYGGSPTGAVEDCLLPVVRLEGQVRQLRAPGKRCAGWLWWHVHC